MKQGLGLGIKLFSMIIMGSLSACGAIQLDAHCTCGYYTTSANKMVSWKDGTKITFVAHKDIAQAHRVALLAVQKMYNDTLASTSISIDTTSNNAPELRNNDPYSVSGDGINGIYILEGDWPFKDEEDPTKVSSADAMTVIRADGKGMQEADIFFRGSSFELTPAQAATKTVALSDSETWVINSAPENTQWLYKVGVHEMGHALGLVHTTDDSIMQPKVSLNRLGDPLTDRDLRVLKIEYAVKASPSAQ